MSAPKYCPTCRQPYSIHAVLGLRPNTIKAEMYDMLRAKSSTGIRSDILFDKLYRLRDGGPLYGEKILQVHVSQLNKMLERHRQIVRSKRLRGTHRVAYYLTKLK